MNLRLLFGLAIVLLALPAFQRAARAQPAQGARPVIVEYLAPPECASTEAFQVLVKTEVLRSPNPDRPWRFSVRIHRQTGAYEGTLTTETGVRQVTAARCDDVTAALAVIIAMAEPEPAAPPPPPPSPPTPIAPPSPPVASPLPPERGPDRVDPPSHIEWRLGARAVASNHGWGTLGGMGFASVELPWGFRKMMFEVGLGTFSAWPWQAYSQLDGPWTMSYVVLDTQACLLDLPIANTGLSVLGCLRVAGATFNTSGGPDSYTVTNSMIQRASSSSSGGALWTGAGVRLRWQTRVALFFEVNFDAMYGTVSGGEGNSPGWVDVGAGLGVRL